MEAGMDARGQPAHHHTVLCDGSPELMQKGTWFGHVVPGSLFIVWGSWWVYSVLAFLLWSRTPSRFRSRGWYPFSSRPGVRLIEPLLKIILPPIAVSVELYFDHPDGFQHLFCPPGTLNAGKFALSNMNNWQHSAAYPVVVLSGLMDLLSAWVPLPPGTTHIFLLAAFGIQAFIMGTHQKPQALDGMVHWLLFLALAGCAVAVALELAAPRNPLPALARGAAAIFQGAWLCQIGAVEFGGRLQWNESDVGGYMMAPVYFCTILWIVLASIVALGLVMAAIERVGAVPAALRPSAEAWAEPHPADDALPTFALLSGADEDGSGVVWSRDKALLTGGGGVRHDDSARCSSGGQTPRSHRASFNVAAPDDV